MEYLFALHMTPWIQSSAPYIDPLNYTMNDPWAMKNPWALTDDNC